MATSRNYTLDWTDDTLKTAFVLTAETLNSNTVDLELEGDRVWDWGEGLNEDWLKLLEHHASLNDAPDLPTEGELWFNDYLKKLHVRHSDEWNEISQRRIDGILPPYADALGGNVPGDLWYDTNGDLLKVYTNNGTWVAVCYLCEA